MSSFQTVRGMRDFLPNEAKMMRYIEDKARKLAELYGYKEIITPVVESHDLLATKAGEEVRLRMYTFKDLGGRQVALRPEFTPSIARLVATTLRSEPRPLRLFCVGSLYRYDEPQMGRYREFWQSNFELIGSDKPEADAEIIMLTNDLMRSLGINNYAFKIGHVGVLRGILGQEHVSEKTVNEIMQLMDRKEHEGAIRLVEDAGTSQRCMRTIQKLIEIKGSDISKLLDKMRECVSTYDDADKSVENLREILKLVSESREKIAINLDAGFARGLEYYTGIIFEVNVPELDKALAGGGRYNKLIELFGGEPTPAVGIAHGIDRMMLAMQKQSAPMEHSEAVRAVVIPTKKELKAEALRIANMLRKAGIAVQLEVMGRKIRKALEDADRRKMNYAVIVGENELKNGAVIVRDLAKREQTLVKIQRLGELITS